MQFHGAPDTAHGWVSTEAQTFEVYMNYLATHQYKAIALRELDQYSGTGSEPADPMAIIRMRQDSLKR